MPDHTEMKAVLQAAVEAILAKLDARNRDAYRDADRNLDSAVSRLCTLLAEK